MPLTDEAAADLLHRIREAVIVTGYLGDQIRRALLAEPTLALAQKPRPAPSWRRAIP